MLEGVGSVLWKKIGENGRSRSLHSVLWGTCKVKLYHVQNGMNPVPTCIVHAEDEESNEASQILHFELMNLKCQVYNLSLID